MKTKQFDALVEHLLKEADEQQKGGSFLSKLGRGLAHAYNAPANFAKGAAKLRNVVQSGEIPLKDKEPQNKGTMTATGDRPKPGDMVNVRLRGLGAAPTGMAGKLENPKPYEGGQLFDVKVTGNPQVDKLRILDKPNEKGTMERQVYYFDKNNMPVSPGFLKQKKLNSTSFFGMNPNIDKTKNPTGREWIVSDDEYPFLPQDQQAQQPGTPGKIPARK